MEDKINLLESNNYYNHMTVKQKARWMSLLMAVDHIDNHCQKHHLSFDEEVLKPIPIKHFIEAKAPQIAHYLDSEINKKKIRNIVYKGLINCPRNGVKV